eukprot:502233_1
MISSLSLTSINNTDSLQSHHHKSQLSSSSIHNDNNDNYNNNNLPIPLSIPSIPEAQVEYMWIPEPTTQLDITPNNEDKTIAPLYDGFQPHYAHYAHYSKTMNPIQMLETIKDANGN